MNASANRINQSNQPNNQISQLNQPPKSVSGGSRTRLATKPFPRTEEACFTRFMAPSPPPSLRPKPTSTGRRRPMQARAYGSRSRWARAGGVYAGASGRGNSVRPSRLRPGYSSDAHVTDNGLGGARKSGASHKVEDGAQLWVFWCNA